MTKRLKNNNTDSSSDEDCHTSLDDKILSSDLNYLTTVSNPAPYHTSLCGSILYSAPTKSSSDIFAYLRHGNFDAFRQSFDLHYNEIVKMKNQYEQTVLHILVIYAYQYVWVRLLMMRDCDPCAQDNDGYTAAHYAVERDDVEMLKALTVRFQGQTKQISNEQVIAIHNKCLKALTIRNKHGLTVFMLACHRLSMKCLDYLISLNINDSNLEDRFGDTCLHYAVARRNQNLVAKLIETCQTEVNGGRTDRPSVLDLLQYNRQSDQSNEQIKDLEIEQLLLSHNARNRCTIRRVYNRRNMTDDHAENNVSNLARLDVEQTTTSNNIETARSHERMAKILKLQGDLNGARKNYEQAMDYVSNQTSQWADYAYELASIYLKQDEKQKALDLLEKSLKIREQLDESNEEIQRIQTKLQEISA